MVSDTNCALPTVRVVEATSESEPAAMVVVPNPALVAKPGGEATVPGLVLIIATLTELEVQPTALVMSCVLPSA